MRLDDPSVLAEIFGEESEGETAEQRAKTSSKRYVRSLDQLAEWSPEATGRELAAYEALEAYGPETLSQVACEGFAILCAGPQAAGDLVRERRELLKLEIRHVANTAEVDSGVIERLESYRRVPIGRAEKVARALGLDERLLSWKPEPPADNNRVAVRLRTIGRERPRLTPTVVSAIAEAAWVASTQLRLERDLDIRPPRARFETSDNYGGPGYPPYLHGYFLAHQVREQLGHDQNPLLSLRELAEETLGIPIIQAEMGSSIAGVTVEFGQDRAIVLNLGGKNRNVFVRRATIAHELGHLLFDPPGRLNALRVDEYSDLERGAHEISDVVEQRANAFAVDLLVPRAAATDHYKAAPKGEGVWAVMNRFGISFTAARYQIWNGLEQAVPLEQLEANGNRTPDPSWEATESYTVDYHPIFGVRSTRAGRFSAVVVRAAEAALISLDTAAAMLETTPADLDSATSAVKDLFPSVFDEQP
jgi:Zn-dependent peptidase ImmA (M78 family)